MTRGAGHLVLRQHVHGGLIQVDQEAGVQRVGDGPEVGQWQNRNHFLAVASTMMRRILVNHEMARRANKRDAELVPLTLSGMEQLGAPPDRDLVAVHEALLALEEVDKRAAKVVELRFFGGMENTEVAQALDISLATVKRDWAVARAWLHRELATR